MWKEGAGKGKDPAPAPGPYPAPAPGPYPAPAPVEHRQVFSCVCWYSFSLSLRHSLSLWRMVRMEIPKFVTQE